MAGRDPLFAGWGTGDARIVGLIGDPVAHSLSPLMHNSAFQALNIKWVYVPFHVRRNDLPEAVAGLRALGLRGVNVTIPHKSAIMPLLDELTPIAAAAGAVNTIVNDGGRLIGDNTDGIGFVRSLQQEAGFIPKDARVLLLGAGGAAQAIAVALARHGVRHIVIANRTVERGEKLAARVRQIGTKAQGVPLDEDVIKKVLADTDLLVQTTPAGMAGTSPEEEKSLPAPLQPHWLHERLVVADIVYTPLHTPLVKAALAKGCTIVPGWGMLLYQGVEAFERWVGAAAPVDVMRRRLKKALGDG